MPVEPTAFVRANARLLALRQASIRRVRAFSAKAVDLHTAVTRRRRVIADMDTRQQQEVAAASATK